MTSLEWNQWKPWYERIIADLGYEPAKDRLAADILAGLLQEKEMIKPAFLREAIQGREIVVFGPVPPLVEPPGGHVKIAAGSACSSLVEMGMWPDMVVTDLDGDVRYQVEANDKGAIMVIHAHGDNINALKEWVPRFRGQVFGTTQVEPRGNIHNFGGFTDGDRAVFLAVHFGADRILLQGFDLDKPISKPGGKLAIKQRKLAYAKELISLANNEYDCEIVDLASS